MNAFPLLSLFAFLLLLLLLPMVFGELMATSLIKLHLSPEAALLLMMAIIIGGLVNIPVKRIAHERVVPVHPLAVFGLGGLWPGLRHPGHKVYLYLLRGKTIDRANQVWAADITYIPMRQGFLYLVAIIDWATRRVLSWRLSNTLTAGFCVEALNEALVRFGKPEIFNTDQGAQFTSDEFTKMLRDHR